MRPIYLISKYYPHSRNHVTSPRDHLENKEDTPQNREISSPSSLNQEPTSKPNPTEMANPHPPNLPPLSTIHPQNTGLPLNPAPRATENGSGNCRPTSQPSGSETDN